MEHYLTEHSITVGLLKVLLDELDDDDLLTLNTVRNFSIERNKKYIGFISLLKNHQEVAMIEMDD